MGCCVYVAGLGVCVHTHAELGHVWRVGGGTGGVFVSAAKVSVQCGKWGRCHEICLWELLSCV